eukprot:Skav226943  [mRNA]  locus=scaffold965:342657:347390:- [translate_table: standard]
MDQGGAGCAEACTLPPAKARDEEVIWYAFQAFDEDKDQVVTIDKVLFMARLVEGQLCSTEQIEELMAVRRGLAGFGLEKPSEGNDDASEDSGVSERLQMEGAARPRKGLGDLQVLGMLEAS